MSEQNREGSRTGRGWENESGDLARRDEEDATDRNRSRNDEGCSARKDRVVHRNEPAADGTRRSTIDCRNRSRRQRPDLPTSCLPLRSNLLHLDSTLLPAGKQASSAGTLPSAVAVDERRGCSTKDRVGAEETRLVAARPSGEEGSAEIAVIAEDIGEGWDKGRGREKMHVEVAEDGRAYREVFVDRKTVERHSGKERKDGKA